jgi:hypothetical protein
MQPRAALVRCAVPEAMKVMSSDVFDALVPLVEAEGDREYQPCLIAMMAQVRRAPLDDARRDQALGFVLALLDGARGPSVSQPVAPLSRSWR